MVNEKLLSKDHFMYELSNWIEIHETRFFATLFEGYDKETFDDLIRYLTYLNQDKETKLTYPKTVYYIDDIIKSIERVRDNTLIF